MPKGGGKQRHGKSAGLWNRRSRKYRASEARKKLEAVHGLIANGGLKIGEVIKPERLTSLLTEFFPTPMAAGEFLVEMSKKGRLFIPIKRGVYKLDRDVMADDLPESEEEVVSRVANNCKPSDDPGTIEHVPLDQLTKVLSQVMTTWGAKGEFVPVATIQGRGELLRQYTRAALSHLLSTVTTNERRLFEKRGGNRGYCLTGEGVAALSAFQNELGFEARSGNAIVVVTSQGGITEVPRKKPSKTSATEPLTKKGGKKLPEGVFDFTTLADQASVEGVVPKGFSKNPELQRSALLLLWALSQSADKVTRGLFRMALRWKYQWGDDVPENSVGRVMFGLMPDYIDIQSVDAGGLNSADDVVTLLEAGRKFAGAEIEAPRQSAPPEPPTKTETDLLREERDAAVVRAEAAEARANTAEAALREHEEKVQAFIEAALNLMGPKGLTILRRFLSN